MQDILECNEKAFYDRYQVSLKEVYHKYVGGKEGTEGNRVHKDVTHMCDEIPNHRLECTEPMPFLLWVIIGIQDIDEVSRVFCKIPQAAGIVIYEPDGQSFLQACMSMDFSGFILDQRVSMVVDFDGKEGKIRETLQQAIGLHNAEYICCFSLPSYDEENKRITDRVREWIREISSEVLSAGVDAGRYQNYSCKNELFTMMHLAENYMAGDLLDLIQDKEVPVILVAAGPSLDHNAVQLKKAKGHAIIMAAAHAAVTLQRYGVMPDLVVHTDPIWESGFLDHDRERREYRLMISARAALDLQEPYQGKCYIFGIDEEHFPEIKGKGNLQITESGGSVMTDVFDIMIRQGFRNFILVGQDLAYASTGETHSNGEYDDSLNNRRHMYTDGIYPGETVETRADWMGFKAYYEGLIEKNEQVRVIDATEGGALINGTEIMSLQQAMDTMCEGKASVDIFAQELPHAITAEEQGKLRRSLMDMLTDIYECGEKIRRASRLNWQITDMQMKQEVVSDEYDTCCRIYDRLFREIFSCRGGEWIVFYAEDVMAMYLRRAGICELNGDIPEKLRNEEECLEKLQEKAGSLVYFIQELLA
ncbi:MAG: DUF115 domain-containing protein [Lachnospiraceae bacterium]|nr:DUF115 domain-containing protein [Lachnospiraceae bacterium]